MGDVSLIPSEEFHAECAKKREEPFKANVAQRLGRNGPQKKGNTPSVSPC